MPNLQYREAEFLHLCELSQYLERMKIHGTSVQGNSPIAVELYDALDMLPAAEIAELVTLYILGRDAQNRSYRDAHQRATQIGFDGVNLLHSSPKFH